MRKEKYPERIQLRLDKEHRYWLEIVADFKEMSMSEVMRKLIKEAFEEYQVKK